MSLALIDDVLLRILSDPNYAAKGSPLTWIELDTDLKIIADAIKELAAVPVDTSGFEEYNNGTTYSDGDFVSYNGNIWKYINPIPQDGITPGSDPLTWSIASSGQFSHERNKDQYLDFGGTNQVSAADLFALVAAGPASSAWADLTGSPTDNTDLVTLLGEYYKLDGSDALTGDMDVNGNDLSGIASILLSGDMTFDLAGDKIFFVDGADDLFTIEKSTSYGNGANIIWNLNDSAGNSQGALVFQKETVGVSGIFSGVTAAADLVLFTGTGYDPSSNNPLGRMYIADDGRIFMGAFGITSGTAPVFSNTQLSIRAGSATSTDNLIKAYDLGLTNIIFEVLNSGKIISASNAKLVLTDYANNAAAVSGGLVVGDLYQTSGTVKIVV